MAIVIREARADEIDETARILAAAFEQHRPTGPGLAPEVRDAFDRYLRDVADVRSRWGQAELLVAAEAGRIVGTATLYPPGREVAYPGCAFRSWPPGWASLRLLGVDPAYRGRAVGRMLTDARVRRARELGAAGVGLHTTPAFEAARGMYRRMGWRRSPEHDYWPIPDVQAEAYVLALA